MLYTYILIIYIYDIAVVALILSQPAEVFERILTTDEVLLRLVAGRHLTEIGKLHVVASHKRINRMNFLS